METFKLNVIIQSTNKNKILGNKPWIRTCANSLNQTQNVSQKPKQYRNFKEQKKQSRNKRTNLLLGPTEEFSQTHRNASQKTCPWKLNPSKDKRSNNTNNIYNQVPRLRL